MKKTLIIILIALALLIGGIVIFATSNANALIAKHKPELQLLVSKALGSTVTIGEITTSILPSTSLIIDEVAIGNSGDGESLSLKNVSLHIALFPLLSKRLEITKLSISNPEITMVRNASGLQIPGIPKAKAPTQPSVEKTTPPSAEESAPPSVSIAVDLQRFEISGGKVIIKDEPLQKTISLSNLSVTSSLNLSGASVTLNDVLVEGVLMDGHPLSLKVPTLSFDTTNSELKLPDAIFSLVKNALHLTAVMQTKASTGTVTIKSDGLEVSRYMPLLSELGFDFTAFNIEGLLKPSYSASLSPSGPEVKGESLFEGSLRGSPVSFSSTGAHFKGASFSAENTIKIFGGTILSPVSLTLGDQISFSSAPTISGLQIDQAMEFLTPGIPSKLYGLVNSVKGNIKGSLGATLMQSLNGDFSFDIQNGGLRGVNIPGQALKAADNIPLLNGAIYQYVGQEFRGALDTENTEFSSMTGNLSLGGGRMNLSNMILKSSTYTLTADGSMGFDSTVEMNATISFSKEFSQALVKSAKDFDKLLTAEGTLVLPLTIRGTLPKVLVIPNLSKVVEIAAKRALKDKASEAVGKALGEKAGGLLKGFGF